MPTCCRTSSGSKSSWRGESTYHGGDGPIRVTQAHHAQNLYEPLQQAAVNYGLPVRDDYNGADSEGISRIELFVGGGERQSSSRAYLYPVLSRRNLTVETGALVTRLLIEKGRAVGVEYTQRGKLARVQAEREVILAGGAYNSPQVLMLSGIGPADHLKSVGITPVHDLPGVGQNLSEHPNMLLMYKARHTDTFLNQLRLDRAIASGARWHLFQDRAVRHQRQRRRHLSAQPTAPRAAGRAARLLIGRQRRHSVVSGLDRDPGAQLHGAGRHALSALAWLAEAALGGSDRSSAHFFQPVR